MGELRRRRQLEIAAAQRGAFFPNVQASFDPSRQRNPVGVLAPTLSSGTALCNLFTTQVSVSYVPDVFGANRRQVESLDALAEASRFQLDATYLTLTANVVTTAIQEASLRAQIAATTDIVNSERETEFAAKAAGALVGLDNVNRNPAPAMGSEDFAWMLLKRPGCYIWIGNGDGEGSCMVHNPGYDFNDEILPIGASYWATLVEQQLARQAVPQAAE